MMLYQGPGGTWFVQEVDGSFQVRELVSETSKSLPLGGYTDLSKEAANRLARRMAERIFDTRVPGKFIYPDM